jgi:hypothetical protein
MSSLPQELYFTSLFTLKEDMRLLAFGFLIWEAFERGKAFWMW